MTQPGAPGDPEPPPSEAEERARALIRREKRNQRKAWADGYMTGITALLGPGDLVLDCGANMGTVTERLAATGADVIAFEPDPYAFGILSEKFGGTPNVTLINAAVGIGSGSVRLMRAEGFERNRKGASVKSTIVASGRGIGDGEAFDVPLVDFPAFLREKAAVSPIAFVKMDIEGAELDILEVMARESLFGYVRCLVAETHERKFRHLRPRYRALRVALATPELARRVNLDWI
jgi:FkbM family methyltransferase